MRSRADAAPAYLYVPDLPETGAAVELSPEESHYATRVCRARAGDSLSATDGAGRVASLEIIEPGRAARARVRSIERRPPLRDVAVWCGPPEGARSDWLVEKLAELGVRTWQPLECERGRWEGGSNRRERWRRLTIAAMRQSRRAHLMEVREPIEVAHAIRTMEEGGERWLASATGTGHFRPAGEVTQVGVIGPASGFSDQENASLRAAGFRPISLSNARLRTETAALAWVVWVTTT